MGRVLQLFSPPDGLCLSDDAWRQVRGKLDLTWKAMEPQRLKNIAEPVTIYSLTHSAVAPHNAKTAAKPSVAVLPFANMSHDPEQEYFSDGITEDLITELSRFRELTVVSRNSSLVFKEQPVAVAEAAERLGVRYIVEGSIRRVGNRVRITAQLIDAHSDAHIWVERFDCDMDGIFEVQDDVVHRVASTLVGRLEHERQERAKRKSQSELRAYDLYLRATSISSPGRPRRTGGRRRCWMLRSPSSPATPRRWRCSPRLVSATGLMDGAKTRRLTLPMPTAWRQGRLESTRATAVPIPRSP